MLEHGGNLAQAMTRYGHRRADWLDLSTGINPHAYPVPPIPPARWHRLPEQDDGLGQAASDYYGSDALLPVPGSQAAIQALPAIVGGHDVGILWPTYNEHERAWQRHAPVKVSPATLNSAAERLDTLIVVNPNNPTGERIRRDTLIHCHARLAERGGTLIVDEAFADTDPCDSVSDLAGRPGLVVLRSLGKFFGLAGARTGFFLGPAPIREALAEKLGPWCLGGPAQFAATTALLDLDWQDAMRERLLDESSRLDTLLIAHGAPARAGCALFRWVPTPDARRWQAHFARAAIWVRAFDMPTALRFGLPGDSIGWARLDAALAAGTREGLRLSDETSTS